jgi:hypothetical protein
LAFSSHLLKKSLLGSSSFQTGLWHPKIRASRKLAKKVPKSRPFEGCARHHQRRIVGRSGVGGDDASTTRIGAVALPLGVIVIMVSECFHPSREDPMDNPAVFMEYARSDSWTTIHLAEYFGFLLL